ncbi:hypothetical protein C8F04DRAFT_1181986 [Mycena alexandri]|uniref:Uncharacterized protein n=1 Tax=Mycena alexandri TaxID=1745969 RepID=A0AAD6T1P2_9AGAR|nr:hypothetical protein C8F04DRAFT_1181986 [Mycena alexandri]
MAIIDSQKSRTIRARDKNPPKSSKPRAKPGPKPKAGPRTTARFDKDARREDLTFHDWGQVFDWMDDHGDLSQTQVAAYFATRPDAEGGKLAFTQSALSKKLKKKFFAQVSGLNDTRNGGGEVTEDSMGKDIFNNETSGSDTNTDSDDAIIYDTSEPGASP